VAALEFKAPNVASAWRFSFGGFGLQAAPCTISIHDRAGWSPNGPKTRCHTYNYHGRL